MPSDVMEYMFVEFCIDSLSRFSFRIYTLRHTTDRQIKSQTQLITLPDSTTNVDDKIVEFLVNKSLFLI